MTLFSATFFTIRLISIRFNRRSRSIRSSSATAVLTLYSVTGRDANGLSTDLTRWTTPTAPTLLFDLLTKLASVNPDFDSNSPIGCFCRSHSMVDYETYNERRSLLSAMECVECIKRCLFLSVAVWFICRDKETCIIAIRKIYLQYESKNEGKNLRWYADNQ